jgi:hypothetical protein
MHFGIRLFHFTPKSLPIPAPIPLFNRILN